MRGMIKKPKAKTTAGKRAPKPRRSKPRTARIVKTGKKSAVDTAISTELAPAAAIAVLEKSEASAEPPALDVLGVGVSSASDTDKVRIQLMFENGTVLPVEMSVEAGKALEAGLAESRAPTT